MTKTTTTNETLCLAMQAGDRQAAEQLYLANYPFIRSIALAYSRRYPDLWLDADDFTQEGAIALLRAAENYSSDTDATFLTYARRVVHNAIRDAIRKALPQTADSTSSECENFCLLDTNSQEHDPERIVLQKERTQCIHAAVANLSERENAWISVRYGLEEEAPLSQAEAARRYHLSSSRARRLEASALRHIRISYMPHKWEVSA